MKINEKLEFPLSQIGIFALILSVMFTAGCGGSKTTFSLSEIGIAEGKGRICMYRPSSLVAMTTSPNVKLDGEVIGKAKNGKFFYIDKEPGEYTISTDALLLAKESLNVTLESGQTIYVEMKAKMGAVQGSIPPILVSEGEGENAIKDCELLD